MEPSVRKTVQTIVGTQVPANTGVRPAASGPDAPDLARAAGHPTDRAAADGAGPAAVRTR
jgi:2-oxoglutarate dehydrogenase complex dehydrogenase (E1) component-like enzyme